MRKIIDSTYGAPKDGEVRIHVMPYNNTDAIIVECDGKFGVVDSGEDSLSPDGADERYPLRGGITVGQGIESQVISYMEMLGITEDNLEFYIGTHPHSDHIGSAADVIRKFHPKTVYTPLYSDSFISEETRLWDNRFVYDRLIEAVESYDGKLVQYLDPDWAEVPELGTDGDEGAPKAMAASKASSVVMRPDSTKRAVTGMKRKTWTASVIFSLVVPYSRLGARRSKS